MSMLYASGAKISYFARVDFADNASCIRGKGATSFGLKHIALQGGLGTRVLCASLDTL
jgi:hypothetical protein